MHTCREENAYQVPGFVAVGTLISDFRRCSPPDRACKTYPDSFVLCNSLCLYRLVRDSFIQVQQNHMLDVTLSQQEVCKYMIG